MNNFSVKLGKTLNLLRQEGIINGLRKSFLYGITFLKSLMPKKAGDVLFVAGGVGDSARFRTHNVAEELSAHGLRCAVTAADNPFLWKLAGKFQIFVFHKVPVDAKIRRFVELVKNQQKEIIFDADDLLFDAAYFDQIDYLKNTNSLEKQIYAGGLGAEILNDPYVMAATTTTSFLAEKLKERGKQVFIVPNKLSDKDLEIADEIMKHKTYSMKQNITIGYFSGAIGHNKDFASINDALVRIMEKFTNVRLLLAGPLDITNHLNRFRERVSFTPFVSRAKHFKNISTVDINIAPLEINNPFCEGKSELKFFEAGIVRVPTVASATQTFKETIEDGVDGFIANDTEEWVEKMEKLITDESLRQAMGERAREKSLREYANKNSHSEEYYGYLKNILAKSK